MGELSTAHGDEGIPHVGPCSSTVQSLCMAPLDSRLRHLARLLHCCGMGASSQGCARTQETWTTDLCSRQSPCLEECRLQEEPLATHSGLRDWLEVYQECL